MNSSNFKNRIVYAGDRGIEGKQIILVQNFVAVNFKEPALSHFVGRFGGKEVKCLAVGGRENEKKCQDYSRC
jgi:hypothetical protein